MELEPSSREKTTYVLQEYFVPVDHFSSFVPKMTTIFREHNVNVINISIRHAHADTLSVLSWAPQEVFCFVIYYKQGTDENAKAEVGTWTRKIIDAALAEGGSYYLPYQLHATEEQFRKAYPHAGDFFALKQKLDPLNKFANKMWDKYYKPVPVLVLEK
jgi:FAD/FMN-containing dehydrogenase